VGELIVSEFITLDGRVEAPERWSIDYWCDGISALKHEETAAAAALVLGRRTYEIFASAWPSRTDKTGFADRYNAMPKHVATTTLTDLEWEASPIAGDVANAVERLKETTDGDLLVHGSARLVGTLMRHDLVDEYRLLTYPVVLGRGARLFPDGIDATLDLTGSTDFPTGAVLLTYRRRPDRRVHAVRDV
jgi:dihydrofolate reductase